MLRTIEHVVSTRNDMQLSPLEVPSYSESEDESDYDVSMSQSPTHQQVARWALVESSMSTPPLPPTVRDTVLDENYANLDPLPNIGTKTVTLPLELLNEPYAYLFEDNDYRPELVVVRPRFLFEIVKSLQQVRVSIGGRVVTHEYFVYEETEVTLSKVSSKCSILNVYDTYGLDLTYAFINYIYHNKFYQAHSSLLIAYVEGSYVHIFGHHSGMVSRDDRSRIALHIRLILVELLSRENNKSKLDYELQGGMATLPLDLLGRILPSERISKQLRTEVRSNACVTIPSLEVVQGWSNGYTNTHIARGNNVHGFTTNIPNERNSYPLELAINEDETYTIRWLTDRQAIIMLREGPLAAVSLQAYADYFISRGCNKDRSLAIVLSDVKRRLSYITVDNLLEACAWLLQLAYDTSNVREGEYTNSELEIELARLIAAAERQYVQN
ncbi:Hypothetical protein POVR2_LOCUS59 [uncultured virus]|nr:Hypothetical protein POVR2_LOCUS59 [uncultured virus]